MPSFKHILFPIDFSQQNCGVAPYVACMARRYGARVTMLHVMEIPSAPYPGWPAHAALIDFQAMIDAQEQAHGIVPEERIPGDHYNPGDGRG